MTFWALGEMVKAQAGMLESDGPAETEAKLRQAVERFVEDATDAAWIERRLRPLAGLDSDEATGDHRDEAFAAWRRYLEAIADERPLVLVFEDLHWADDALLDFVDYLVDWASGVPLLVLCTARPELLTRRSGWGGGKVNSSTILLSPLSEEQTATLLHALLGRSAIDADLQERLLTHAGGNPLYAEEFTRMLLSRPGDVVLPETVQGIIAARLDTLPVDEKELLQEAAVVGRVFWLGALGRERWTLEERLHSLTRKEFVTRNRRSAVAGRGRVCLPPRTRPRRGVRADPASGASGQASCGRRVDRVARADPRTTRRCSPITTHPRSTTLAHPVRTSSCSRSEAGSFWGRPATARSRSTRSLRPLATTGSPSSCGPRTIPIGPSFS